MNAASEIAPLYSLMARLMALGSSCLPLPPLAAFAVSSTASNFTGSAIMPVYATPTYNTVTDEVIVAPVIDQDKAAQS